jgi:hypothetical protein
MESYSAILRGYRHLSKIKEEDEYDGVRIKFQADLAGARMPMQIDIEFDKKYAGPPGYRFGLLD